MKTMAMAAGGLVVLVLAFLAALPSKDLDPAQVRRLRGREAYFVGPMEEVPFEVIARLLDKQLNVTLKVQIIVRYQRGMECDDAGPLIEERRSLFLDALNLYFSDRQRSDMAAVKNRGPMRRELMVLAEKSLFPEGAARVRRILFPTWQFQVRRGS